MEDENDYKFPPCLRKTASEFWNSPRNFDMGMDFLRDSTDEESECDTIAYDNEDPDVDFKHLSTSGDDATKNNVVLFDFASIDSEKLQKKLKVVRESGGGNVNFDSSGNINIQV